MKGWLVAVSILLGFSTNAQENTEFRSPLDIPLFLSGTFAELRGNHFHGGLDIKTNGKTGYQVYATKRGFVSRVKVQAGGYGNAVYIEHPNGFTTVYGHLRSFNDVIAKRVKAEQYKQKSFGVDLYFSPSDFPVSQGEVIGLSGNSGSSGGPHLHYEIRRAGQRPINPMVYTPIKDDIKPTIQSVRVHELSEGFYQANSQTLPASYISSGNYKLSKDTIIVSDPLVGVSIKAIDKQNGTNNSNGFHDLKLFVDGQLNYHYAKDEVGFDESRYINSHIDFPAKVQRLGSYSNAFKLPNNQLQFLDPTTPDGRIWLSAYNKRQVKIEVCDLKGNTSTVNFYVKYVAPASPKMVNAYTQYFPYDQSNYYSANGIRLSIPPRSFYDNVKFQYEQKMDLSGIKYPIFSGLHQVHNDKVPMHKLMTIGVEAINFPDSLRSKALLATLNSRNRINVNSGNWEGNYFSAKTRNFGTFFITVDTKAPKIVAYKQPKGKVYSSRESVRFKITDNLSGIKSYTGTVNGQWVLMEFDAKNALLQHKFDNRIPKGPNTLKLRVTDYVGNTTELDYKFTR